MIAHVVTAKYSRTISEALNSVIHETLARDSRSIHSKLHETLMENEVQAKTARTSSQKIMAVEQLFRKSNVITFIV